MANDERRSDTFIREVDEELRREQLKALWDRFGWAFIGVCVLIVVIVAGYRGMIWWQERQAAEAGDRFVAALEILDAGDREAGEAELRAIMEEEGAGYAALAQFRLAGEAAAAGDTQGALAAYDAIAADGSLAGSLRDAARLKAALLALDMGDTSGAEERAGLLDVTGNPWRHAAREVLGLAAYEGGDLRGAREYFSAMQLDAETPIGIWQRAGVMNALIDGQLETAADEDMTADEPSDEASGEPGAEGQ